MVARNRKPTKGTREIFSDDVSQVEIETIRTPVKQESSPQQQQHQQQQNRRTSPPYSESRPVKFINIRIGTRFLLNGGMWEKINHDQATNLIQIGEREVIGATLKILPWDLVFVKDVPGEGRAQQS